MMTDKVCYPARHIPIYIAAIIFISLIFFLLLWPRDNQNQYKFYYSNYPTEKYSAEIYPTNIPRNYVPDTVTVGNHNSATGSSIIASPYTPPPKYDYGHSWL